MNRAISNTEVERAKSEIEGVVARMDAVFSDGTVVCLPTAPTPAPARGDTLSAQSTLLSRTGMLTCIAGSTSVPQISLPMAELDGLPVGLSLMVARASDELLLSFAREVADALGD
jgi:amidase